MGAKMIKIERALLSVSDKTGLSDLGSFLHKQGVEILSSGGTARHLKEEGIPVIEVSDFTTTWPRHNDLATKDGRNQGEIEENDRPLGVGASTSLNPQGLGYNILKNSNILVSDPRVVGFMLGEVRSGEFGL